jgi:hypothetical protein
VGSEYVGDNDAPAPPEVRAFAECLSASGVSKAEASNDAYYGSRGRIFVPGGEVFVFADRQAAEGAVVQIEADDAEPQVLAGTLAIIGVPMPEQGGPFPLAESSRCAYGPATG